MKVITAPEPYISIDYDAVTCFLAGGITNCPNWQNEVIENLRELEMNDKDKPSNYPELIIFNPRRESFPIHNPNAAQEQIKWKFKYLNQALIFSMYFCNADSDQPICMYELGRHLYRCSYDEVCDVIISVEDGYRRAQDVIIQTKLAVGINEEQWAHTGATPKSHAELIYREYKSFYQ